MFRWSNVQLMLPHVAVGFPSRIRSARSDLKRREKSFSRFRMDGMGIYCKGLLGDAIYEVLWNQSLAFSLYCVVSLYIYICVVYSMIYVYLCIISYSYHTLSLQFNSWPYIDTYHNLKLITMLICIIHLVCVCTGGIRLSLSLSVYRLVYVCM